ncbi:type IX secretion system sortase PorU [Marivirga sp. S37H4]|uniref:Type IX secretion system sortase PorU n=1 Tax=Marivirga aurantiaca TaxID=2802615 RepID=A0A935CCA6_9BACT|nr:type IX secretion system sortase PorU [Marivirga aurantiaca]MBK6267372.1 type IX secretion system sortase PorU [Marivirga aurantiaca]
MNYRLLFIFLLTISIKTNAQSVLKKAGLVKIATTQEGVYKIDRDFLTAISLDPTKVNPNKIQIYGMPGGTIPQANAIDYPIDPQPLSVQVEANQNNTFDAGELVFFYSDAIQNTRYDFDSETYEYSNNLYADSLYFFIDFNVDTQSKQLETLATSQLINGATTIDWFERTFVHELDEANIENSGREWFGESFATTKTRDFTFNISNELATNKPVHLRTTYMAQTYSAASLKISLNNFDLADVQLPTINNSAYGLKGSIVSENSTISTSLLAGNDIVVELVHQGSGADKSEGRLDNLFMTVPLKLKYNNEQIILRNREFQAIGSYNISIEGVNSQYIWDVSHPINAKSVDHVEGDFSFNKAAANTETKFIVFNEQNAFSPIFIEEIVSQDLKSNPNPDFLIITTSIFKSAAEELARHRRAYNNFEVEITTTEAIFNEFGSGRRDVSAMRNYIKYLYDKQGGQLKYVLMMGAGSYDYKDRIDNNTNFIPIYQSRNSLHPVFTYSSDDFFGFMEDHEGEWEESSNNVDDIDIGIGRIPCTTLQEAQQVVKKIIDYETKPNALRKWRNEIYFIADDGDDNAYQIDSEQLSKYVIDNYNFFNINKLYLGAFEQESFASSERSPKMISAIDEMIEKGALIVNYIGHGAESSLTDEGILTKSMISKWNNVDRLPLFVTATCEFGRHDNPRIVSGAQDLILKKDAGAIGLLTTARPVLANSNYKLNEAFYNSVFDREGKAPRKLGDIVRHTKNNGLDGVYNRNFILLGDPALTLAEPMHQAKITNIVNEAGETDTLKSMSKISVSGEIFSYQNQKMSNFNGVLTAELFDKAIERRTFDPNTSPLAFDVFESVLYRGQASISNGEFSFTFYMPKNMNYQVDAGKLSLYARPNEGNEDANGFYNDFYVGGSNSMDNNDDLGPDISVFMDDYSFRNKDKVGSDATLLLQLFDEHGISISEGGLDKGIIFTLDDNDPVELNDYFYYDLDSYQQGEVFYNLKGLKGGWHDLKVQAKDVFNNSSEETIEFFVVDNEKLEILNFIMYPNPAKEFTNFKISQNRRNEDIEVIYNIIDTYGKVVHEQSFLTSDQQREDSWNLKGKEGVKVAPGLYFIRVFLRSVEDQSKTQQIKKLIVIN